MTFGFPPDRVQLPDPAHWSESFPVATGRREGPQPDRPGTGR